ncbi:MAG: transposase [Opitutales bacterium]|nr:transposase [Opitutales bacterium]MCH8539604.1 transposase [Opitutales bacterium]
MDKHSDPIQLPIRKTTHLQRGRTSTQGAKYFITINTKNRKSGLCQKRLAETLIQVLRGQHSRGDFEMIAGTIMPEHIHLLIRLGSRLTLSATIGKFKSQTKQILADSLLVWQKNFFDHKLRADHISEGFAKYIFLNPYRRGLLTSKEIWPWWFCNKNYRPEFFALLLDGQYPHPKWIEEDVDLESLFGSDKED